MNNCPRFAREFAVKAHGSQMYGSLPYVHHLDDVATIVCCEAPGLSVAAYLHDILEDTETTRADLEAVFSLEVAEMVWAMTGTGTNRTERVSSLFPKLALCPRAITVKQADRLANGRSSKINRPGLFRRYAQEHAAFNNKLRPVGGSIALWQQLDELFA